MRFAHPVDLVIDFSRNLLNLLSVLLLGLHYFLLLSIYLLSERLVGCLLSRVHVIVMLRKYLDAFSQTSLEILQIIRFLKLISLVLNLVNVLHKVIDNFTCIFCKLLYISLDFFSDLDILFLLFTAVTVQSGS